MVGARIAAAATGEVAWEPDREAPVPQVVFSDPEVASVGHDRGRGARGGARRRRLPGADLRRPRAPACCATTWPGESQLVVDAGSRLLLGATFVGPEVGELVHAATVAIVGGVPVHVLRHAVASYPTASELWLRLLEELPRGSGPAAPES